MQLLVALLIVGFVDLTLLVFVRQLKRERFDVANKGVNQSGVVTLAKATTRTVWQVVRYTLPFYLVIALYFFLLLRRDCRQEPDTRARYETTPAAEHLLEALTWPGYVSAEPTCDE